VRPKPEPSGSARDTSSSMRPALRPRSLVLVLLCAACGKGSGSDTGGSGGSSESGASSGSGSDDAAVYDAAVTTSGASTGSSGVSGSGSSDEGGVSGPDGGYGASGDGGACSSALSGRVRITEVDVGVAYDYNEVDSNGPGLGLTPLAISPMPGGGSRLAFLGNGDGMVHVATLDAGDQLVAGSVFGLPAYDFQDIYADDSGGVVLVSRSAQGSTANNNCGNIDNLCGVPSAYPTTASCYDMYMVRFDAVAPHETWATNLTDTSATVSAYGSGPTGGNNVVFIWSEYAHNGRIAFDGSNYAGYFGAAITVPGQACSMMGSALTMGVNIHQGDRMKVVNGSGALQPTPGFDFGCSHSGYERVIWDPSAKQFVPVCKNDLPAGSKAGRLAFPANWMTSFIDPVDLYYSDLGSVLLAGGGGYWVVSSDIRSGQPANAAGFADVHLLHVPSVASPTADHDLKLVSDTENDRAPHLVAYGSSLMVAAWEESTGTGGPGGGGDLAQDDPDRKMYVQVLDKTTGAAPSGSTTTAAGPLNVPVLGSRYQDFRAYPDGSVAYPAPGSSSTKIKILRILGCGG
jgi:hypothetical protein